MKLSNVEVSLNDSYETLCLSWEMGGFRFHVWTHSPEILYKNPPIHVKLGEPEYFDTRKLNALAHGNAQMIALARLYALNQKAFEKAKAVTLAAKAVEAEENRVRFVLHNKRGAAEVLYDALIAARAYLQFLPPDDVVAQIDAAIAKANGI
jgi:hypothetical protein